MLTFTVNNPCFFKSKVKTVNISSVCYVFMCSTTACTSEKKTLLLQTFHPYLQVSYHVNHRCAVMPLGESVGFLTNQTLQQIRVLSSWGKDNHLVKPSILKKTCILTTLNAMTTHLLPKSLQRLSLPICKINKTY